tara:strand:+ start:24 stop:464 length:441 start_codon:yes stop_codon:yes gene_type:complete
MADFAQLNSDNLVKQVIVVDDNTITDNNGRVSEYVGVSFCQQIVNDFSTVWKQTSNTMRGNPAGIGMIYMSNVSTLGLASTDIFIKVQPYESWTVGVNTASWFAPIAEPALTSSQISDNKTYSWDEVAYQADTSDPKTVGWALSTR